MTFFVLKISGETWAAYPKGMRFPRQFAYCYPFRGRGVVAKVLFLLNRLHLDGVLLRSEERACDGSVAYFWPSTKRSAGRFYGYRVAGGKVTEYIKFATTDDEKAALRREAANAVVAQEISHGLFYVPRCIGTEEHDGVLSVRFEPLPRNAVVPPLTADWIARAEDAGRRIRDAGYMHGDFAWHNFKAVDDQLWILDWEEMQKGGPCLSDEISLDFGLKYYWQHVSKERVVREFEERYRGCRWELAKEAVRDLMRRRVTMGDILKEAVV